jgi:hypothetical protein
VSKTNRYEIAFVAAVLILATVALACGTTVVPPACAAARTQGNDEFRRWAAAVSRNGAAVSDDCWNPLVDNDTLSADNSGEAELNFSACWSGRIFIFRDSGGTFRAQQCRKADYPASATCVAFGTWYAGQCAGEFLIHSGSASIEKTGTTLSVTYLPDKLDLTLVVVLDGSVRVTPVDSYDPTMMGPAENVAAGAAEGVFYFTMPLDRLGPVGGLEPRRVYPVSELPKLLDELGIRDWMLQVAGKAKEDNVLPPNWPQELGGTGQTPPQQGIVVTLAGKAVEDPAVSEAFLAAVDWLAVQSAAAPGGAIIARTPAGETDVLSQIKYDPERAQALLKEANYNYDQPVVLLFPVEPQYDVLGAAADIVIRSLAALGIKTDPRPVPAADINAVLATRIRAGETVLALSR